MFENVGTKMSSLIPHQLFNETVKSGTDILEDKAQIENHAKGVRAKRIKGAQKAAAKRAAKRGTS